MNFLTRKTSTPQFASLSGNNLQHDKLIKARTDALLKKNKLLAYLTGTPSRQTPSRQTPLRYQDVKDPYIIILSDHNNLRLEFLLKVIKGLISFFNSMSHIFNATPYITELTRIKPLIDKEYKESFKYVSDSHTIEQIKRYRELFIDIIECIKNIRIPNPTDKTLKIYKNSLDALLTADAFKINDLKKDDVAYSLDYYDLQIINGEVRFNAKLNIHRNILYYILTVEFIRFNVLIHYIFKYINYLALLLNNPKKALDIDDTISSITKLQETILLSQSNSTIIDRYNLLINASKLLKNFKLTDTELQEHTNIKEEESDYISEAEQIKFEKEIEAEYNKKIGAIPDFEDDEIFGGRRKPTKATMNMKDIRRLCKANQIKLSTTKDGVCIIYKKKELITKLKRRKIL